MKLQQRKLAFELLGIFLKQFEDKGKKDNSITALNQKYYNSAEELIQKAQHHNGWFTENNVRNAFTAIGKSLDQENIEKWLSAYTIPENPSNPRKIGVIMAGNIPLVGFHDFLCVLISGNQISSKMASEDKLLLPFITEVLITIEPEFESYISFIEGKLQGIDAIIATGGNNTSRYFEYYFGKYPHIIRKNRNSLAVLEGTESEEELKNLGKDIFYYYGLGCRNVSKIFIPVGFDINTLFKAIFDFNAIINHNKYANNYDYNKVVYLMKKIPLLDNGFLLLKEDSNYASPVAVLHYEYYIKTQNVLEKIKTDREKIQCIVAKNNVIPESVDFGETQFPGLWDYADGVDTLQFLLTLN